MTNDNATTTTNFVPQQRYKSKFDLLRAKTTRKSQIMRLIEPSPERAELETEESISHEKFRPKKTSFKESIQNFFKGHYKKHKSNDKLPENSYLKDIISKTGVGLTPLILPLVQIGGLKNEKYEQLEENFKQVSNDTKLNYVYKSKKREVKKRSLSRSPSNTTTPLLSFRRSSTRSSSKTTTTTPTFMKGDYDNNPVNNLYETSKHQPQNKKLSLKYSSSDSSKLETFKTEIDKTLNDLASLSDFIPQSSSANTIPPPPPPTQLSNKSKESNKKKIKKQKTTNTVDTGVNTEISMCNAIFTIKYDNSNDESYSKSSSTNVYGYLNDYDSFKRLETKQRTRKPHNYHHQECKVIPNRGRIEVPKEQLRSKRTLQHDIESSVSSVELPIASEILRKKLENELNLNRKKDLIYVNKSSPISQKYDLNDVQILLSLMPLNSAYGSRRPGMHSTSSSYYSPKLEILEEAVGERQRDEKLNFRQLYSKLMSPLIYESNGTKSNCTNGGIGYEYSYLTPSMPSKRNSNDTYLTQSPFNDYDNYTSRQNQYKIRYPPAAVPPPYKPIRIESLNSKPISYTFNSDIDDEDTKIDYELNRIRQNVCNRLKFDANFNDLCLKIA